MLYLIFNRPDLVKITFEKIREVKPRQLFIGADGPRNTHPDDQEKCQECRQVVLGLVEWECEVNTLFRDTNLGCGRAPAEAITWFFSQVEMGIILEDDILPDITFFSFCEDLLGKYRFDERIMIITGFNALGKWNHQFGSYFFSEGDIWGWASWRRAWELYDFQMEKYDDMDRFKGLMTISTEMVQLFEGARNKIKNGASDFWDYQWYFARVINSGLGITPSVNLIRNLGFGIDATHTLNASHPLSNIDVGKIEVPIVYNNMIIKDTMYLDQCSKIGVSPVSLLSRMKSLLKSISERI